MGDNLQDHPLCVIEYDIGRPQTIDVGDAWRNKSTKEYAQLMFFQGGKDAFYIIHIILSVPPLPPFFRGRVYMFQYCVIMPSGLSIYKCSLLSTLLFSRFQKTFEPPISLVLQVSMVTRDHRAHSRFSAHVTQTLTNSTLISTCRCPAHLWVVSSSGHGTSRKR